MEDLLIVARFVQFAAVMSLFGASLFPLYALAGECPPVDGLLRRTAPAASLLALVSAVAWLLLEASLMSGDPAGFRTPHTLGMVLHSSEFGHIWQWRLPLLTVLLGFTVVRWRLTELRYQIGLAVLSGLAVATLAGVGHGAMGIGWASWLHLGNQATHMLAGSIWVGGLAALLALVLGRPDHEMLVHALRRFSAIGLGVVLVVLASGLLNAWFLVGSFHALFTTAYGHVLLVKLAFFMGMIALALYNRLMLLPRLVRGDELRTLICSVAIEQGCALLVLAAVSVLGTMEPAFGMAM